MSVVTRHTQLFAVNAALKERQRSDGLPDQTYRNALTTAQRELDAGRSTAWATTSGFRAMRRPQVSQRGGDAA